MNKNINHIQIMKSRLVIALLMLIVFKNFAIAQTDMNAGSKNKSFDPYNFKKEKTVSEEQLIYRGDKTKAYWINPNTGDSVRTSMDTITWGFFSRQSADGRSLATGYLGNYNSPWVSKMFFDLPEERNPFFYNDALYQLLYSPQKARFYDTKSPFTNIIFTRNFDTDNRNSRLNATFSSNYGKRLNLGCDLDYTYSNGYYESSKTKDFNYRVFASYRLDRYEIYAAFGNDYFNITENGGIANDRYITHPQDFNKGKTDIRTKDIPVNFPGSKVFNTIRQGHAFLTHRFNLGYHKDIEVKDEKGEIIEDKDSTIFIPVGSIVHSLRYSKNHRRFIAKPGIDWEKFYPKIFIKGPEGRIAPNDTTEMSFISNTLALSLREGFRPWVKFGLTAYTRLENRSYHLMDSIPNKWLKESDYDLYLGGEINSSSGKHLNFRVNGEVSVLGENIGTVRLNGIINTSINIFKQKTGLDAWASLSNTKASYLIKHQHGTLRWWDINFDDPKRMEFGGRLYSEGLGLEVNAKTATLKNHIYFDEKGLPGQQSDAIQVFSAEIKESKKIGILGIQLQAAYQKSSNQKVVPLPEFAAYANLFLDFYIAKVMHTQIGVDARFHTEYKAPSYDPATMQFYNQTEINIGGKAPLMTLYLNAHLKRARFFLEMYNIGEAIFAHDRFSLPHYAIDPMAFKFGIAVDFNN